MKLTGRILRCLVRKDSTGTNYAVEVWDEKPHDLRLMSEIALTVVGVLNKNSGVPSSRAVIAPRSETEQAPAAA
jgi:hypothetical protein